MQMTVCHHTIENVYTIDFVSGRSTIKHTCSDNKNRQ